jgi:methyltransferase-like protein
VRQRILEIFRNNLSPQGIAYVSFNTLPGCRLRGVVRELMCHHSAQFDDPQQAVAQARAMLALAAESQTDDSPFANLVREGYMCLSQADDSYLYHEMLAEHNQPFYFQEFVGQVESAGLQYLGDADVPRMFTFDLPPTARTFLEGMPLLVREQYLDFLRGSSFRKSLLCHKVVEVERRLDHRVLNRFSVSLGRDARLERSEAGAGEAWRLIIGSCEIPCPDPGVVAALRYLDERRPEFISVAELRKIAPGRVDPEDSDSQAGDRLTRFFMDALTAGAVDAALSAPRLASRVSERPVASPLARLQAELGNSLTNQLHESIKVTDLGRLVVRVLDGNRDRQALIEVVRQEVKSGRVSLTPFEDLAEAATIEDTVEDVVAFLGRSALLVA